MDPLQHQFRRAADAMRRAGRVLLVIHRKPDGDCLGAASAMLAWCRASGLEAAVFCRDSVPVQYSFLPDVFGFTDDQDIIARGWPVISVLDAGDLRYAGIEDLLVKLPKRPIVIDIDHHADNVLFGDVNVVDGGASSACEIVYRFLKEDRATAGGESVLPRACRRAITPEMATALMTGILFDTGSLSNPATSAASMLYVAELMRLGGNPHDYNTRIIKSKSVAALRLWGEALSRLKGHDGNGLASTALFAEELAGAGVAEEEIEGISNFLDSFLDAPALIVLKEMAGGTVKGSLRTKEDMDVSIPARLMGGGGHKKAAGFTVAGRVVETERGFRIERVGNAADAP